MPPRRKQHDPVSMKETNQWLVVFRRAGFFEEKENCETGCHQISERSAHWASSTDRSVRFHQFSLALSPCSWCSAFSARAVEEFDLSQLWECFGSAVAGDDYVVHLW